MSTYRDGNAFTPTPATENNLLILKVGHGGSVHNLTEDTEMKRGSELTALLCGLIGGRA